MQAVSPVVAAPVKSASETVLLVEDEAGVRQLSKRILDNAGYRVLEAANGDDAEKLFAHHADSIDLVVTDVIMPGCGGPELLSRLQVHAPALRVLYMSGYTEQSAARTRRESIVASRSSRSHSRPRSSCDTCAKRWIDVGRGRRGLS